ncbi:Phosphoribosylaminoimidazole-succinocarboxamide synthase [Candidatus Anstonella stagnisolia]|nr:Phosphoribosylaminoimidazole-succinocarboxamide synthase [Candidatus Anstonella stagnisolia]
MEAAITSTNLPFRKFSSGKVRETYELEDGHLLMVSTDRLSAFDVVFSQGIPYKGAVLNELSLFWFEKLASVTKNHLAKNYDVASLKLSPAIERRSMVVKRAKMLPIECVVRGYLAGSGLKEYMQTQSVCGIKLPAGLRNSSQLPQPIFTPSTKAEKGHDININHEQGAALVGKEKFNGIEELALKVYSAAAAYAKTRGIILADTKFEFGEIDGEIVLADEVLTPDSSRYWPAALYEEGKNQPSYDKQYVRDYVEGIGWGKKAPAPILPQEVVHNTAEKYIEAYEKISGKKFQR